RGAGVTRCASALRHWADGPLGLDFRALDGPPAAKVASPWRSPTVVKLSYLFSFAAAAGFLLAPAAASANDSLNPALGRLVLDHRCNARGLSGGGFGDYVSGHPTDVGRFNDSPGDRAAYFRATGRDSCAPDDAAFKKLIAQWGFALAPTAMHTAR